MFNWTTYIKREPNRLEIRKKYKNHPRYYFAYGSNLNLKQMETRCPTAELIYNVRGLIRKLLVRSLKSIHTIFINWIVMKVIQHFIIKKQR